MHEAEICSGLRLAASKARTRVSSSAMRALSGPTFLILMVPDAPLPMISRPSLIAQIVLVPPASMPR
jgi:hypothetical protein